MSAPQTKSRDSETQALSSLHKCRFTFHNGVEGRGGYLTCEKRCFCYGRENWTNVWKQCQTRRNVAQKEVQRIGLHCSIEYYQSCKVQNSHPCIKTLVWCSHCTLHNSTTHEIRSPFQQMTARCPSASKTSVPVPITLLRTTCRAFSTTLQGGCSHKHIKTSTQESPNNPTSPIPLVHSIWPASTRTITKLGHTLNSLHSCKSSCLSTDGLNPLTGTVVT